jgi:hypothetical protein
MHDIFHCTRLLQYLYRNYSTAIVDSEQLFPEDGLLIQYLYGNFGHTLLEKREKFSGQSRVYHIDY